MDNEDYIFLDYDLDSGDFSVRKGYSYKDSGSPSWSGDEETYGVDKFIEQYPEKTNQLIADIENDYED